MKNQREFNENYDVFYINVKLIYRSYNNTFGEYKFLKIPEEIANIIFSEENLEYFELNGGLRNYGFVERSRSYCIL